MPTSNRFTVPGARNKSGCLFPLIAFPPLLALGFVVTLLTEPALFAKASKCTPLNSDTLTYANTCSYAVNLQYCMFSKSGPDHDLCRDFHLEPDEETPSLRADLAVLGGLLNNSKLACKAPYLPGQKRDTNNKRLKPACREVGQEGVGPHVSRGSPAPEGTGSGL
ncbi:MAG: hypothetical protein R3C52_15290 [Hyphomonadaceae bacterium]